VLIETGQPPIDAGGMAPAADVKLGRPDGLCPETAANDESVHPPLARLEFESASGLRRRFWLSGRTVIGSDHRAGVRIALPGIERFHCEVILDPVRDASRGQDLVVLRDLGSEIGTTLNDQPIETVSLRDGDRIGIGPVRLRFRAAASSTEPVETRSADRGGAASA